MHVVTDMALPVFWSTPNADEVENFVWDTDVPQVTTLWPHMELHRFDLKTVVHALSGRVDVTDYLYELADLEEMLRNDETTVLEPVA